MRRKTSEGRKTEDGALKLCDAAVRREGIFSIILYKKMSVKEKTAIITCRKESEPRHS